MHKRKISQLPTCPAVYALIGGRSEQELAYVGVSDELKRRITQHIEKRSSSITTGSSIVSLDSSKVTRVHWWEDEAFKDRDCLEAAEFIAIRILKPTLRSKANVTDNARKKLEDEVFVEHIKALIKGRPTGELELPTFEQLVERLEKVEEELALLRNQNRH
jgi:hypothetical protein